MNQRRMRGREVKIRLEGPGGRNNGVMIHIESVKLERYARMTLLKNLWGMWLVEGVVVEIGIVIWIMRQDQVVDRRNLRRKVCGSFQRLGMEG